MRLMKLFEEVNNEINRLYDEGKKYFPELKYMKVILRRTGKEERRFATNWPTNRITHNPDEFKKYLSLIKIRKTVKWLSLHGEVKDIRYSKSSVSAYLTFNGKTVRLSNHPTNFKVDIDVLIDWDTPPNKVVEIFKELK